MRSRILPITVRKSWVVMFVPRAFFHEMAEKRIHIVPQGILNLGEKHPSGGVQRGNHTHTVPYSTLSEESLHFVGQIKELHFLSRMKLYCLRFDQHYRSPSPL